MTGRSPAKEISYPVGETFLFALILSEHQVLVSQNGCDIENLY
jgi:hypothetical protein